ncbi:MULTISPECIES: TRAFAC clade GTPase domain-containing protein [Saccharothrix]|uniref:TRAFAC clade GTPase domain-containing protein n=1 Tax=Saccharothrix TaxID=2071 RepID=UPI00093DFB6A|nr:hypothetical protein [Saccharothrix sp. CB00851]OKI26353.1 hypothetical protein A6A25_32210 [Saccharothrix sp. CB00851]
MTVGFFTLVAFCALVLVLVPGARFALVLVWHYGKAVAIGYGLGKSPNARQVKSPEGKRTADAEPAWEFYLMGQAWRDVQHVHSAGAKSLWAAVVERSKVLRERHFVHPDEAHAKANPRWRGVIGYFGVGVGLVLAVPVLLLASVSAVSVLGVLLLVSLGTLYVLRAVDTVVLRVRGIRMTCNTCGLRVTFALYGCPGCKTLHGNVRPGRYGMLYRRCRCGMTFPSLMVLTALVRRPGRKPTLWCPHSDTPHQLSDDSGSTPEIVLPVFGATSAGKSQLITVFIIALEAIATRSSGKFAYADQSTRDRATNARLTLETKGEPGKTKAVNRDGGVVAPAYSLRVKPRRGQGKLVHVFDAAGEIFDGVRQVQELEYFKIARTFVFVIDPMSIKAVWETFEERRKEELKDRRAQPEPFATFNDTVSTMTSMGIDMRKVHLAVAVSKADLIRHLLDDVDTEDPVAIRAWLETLEQGNLTRAMDLNFKEVSYFLTSALPDGNHEAHHSVEKFTEKTLAEEGLRL